VAFFVGRPCVPRVRLGLPSRLSQLQDDKAQCRRHFPGEWIRCLWALAKQEADPVSFAESE